jgi:hypothetical protein
MAFEKTTHLKIGLALGFLGILLTLQPVLCRGQAELNPDHNNVVNVPVSIAQPAAEVRADASKARRRSARTLPQQSSASTVILWNDAAIEAARDNNSGPLVMVRALAMMHTAMFDAWAEYDTDAQATLEAIVRRPASERTTENKQEAVSYAAYRVLADLFPCSRAKLDRLMATLGYDPKADLQDHEKPSAVGIRAATEMLDHRQHDGSNQLGDVHPGGYSDYTNYATANTPDVIRDPDRWQPLNDDQDGRSVTQVFYMPHWGRVKPFGFASVLDVRPQATPKTLRNDPAGYIMQAKDLVELTNNLTERQKVIAEYWELSQGRETNVVLWNQFAQFVSWRDHHELDDDVKLFFALDNAMFDSSIAAWDAKRYWDSERPQTAIASLAHIFHGYLFHDDWQPYLPTPPFPDFVSSHSVLSAAAAEILKRFSGSDEFGGSYRRPAGVSGMEGKPGPVREVVLSWPTFTEAADESGMSQRFGGIHFEDADVEGRLLGRRVGALSWNKAQAYVFGRETEKRLPVRTQEETDLAGW